jgi:hypothetical protein
MARTLLATSDTARLIMSSAAIMPAFITQLCRHFQMIAARAAGPACV